MSGLLPDYGNQARSYDSTRSASPSVLGPLREALRGAPGRRLLDVGGGTGNYALALRDEGAGTSSCATARRTMLARAAAKGLETVEADAQALPFADASFDALICVSMLHHVDDRPRALAEQRRVLRPGGRGALMLYTREDIEHAWYHDYFPSTRAWMDASHPRLADLMALLPGARRIELVFRDLAGRIAGRAVGVPRQGPRPRLARADELLRAPGPRPPRRARRRPRAPARRHRIRQPAARPGHGHRPRLDEVGTGSAAVAGVA